MQAKPSANLSSQTTNSCLVVCIVVGAHAVMVISLVVMVLISYDINI